MSTMDETYDGIATEVVERGPIEKACRRWLRATGFKTNDLIAVAREQDAIHADLEQRHAETRGLVRDLTAALEGRNELVAELVAALQEMIERTTAQGWDFPRARAALKKAGAS